MLRLAAGFALASLTLSLSSGAVAQNPGVLPVPGEKLKEGQTGYNRSTNIPLPTKLDELRTIAMNVNIKRSEFYRKGDLEGVTSLYTSDATYVELMPRFSVMKGHDEIQKHMQELLKAKASDLILTVTTAQMVSDDRMSVGGDYYVLVDKNKRISGHFFQELRGRGGDWKISLHMFARPEPVTTIESNEYNTRG
jgi:uncharacterized protein (TIGR02246 family)